LNEIDCSNGGRRIFIETLLPFEVDGQDASSHPCVKGWPAKNTALGSVENYYKRELCWYMLNKMDGKESNNTNTWDSTLAPGQLVQLAAPFDCFGDASGVYA
jgi:hypothetical protein